MIRHIVFFSVNKDQDVEDVCQRLRALATIPHSEAFEVVRNSKVDPMCDRIDLVVYGEFRDEAALAAFKAHPTYDATTQAVRPMRELRYSADFTSTVSSTSR